jgi:hypothetical protein
MQGSVTAAELHSDRGFRGWYVQSGIPVIRRGAEGAPVMVFVHISDKKIGLRAVRFMWDEFRFIQHGPRRALSRSMRMFATG